MKKIKAVKMATGGLMSQPPYIAKDDLIKCKKAAGRLKDLADIEELEKI